MGTSGEPERGRERAGRGTNSEQAGTSRESGESGSGAAVERLERAKEPERGKIDLCAGLKSLDVLQTYIKYI